MMPPVTMRTIQIAGDEGMHDYGVLLANEERKWQTATLATTLVREGDDVGKCAALSVRESHSHRFNRGEVTLNEKRLHK